MKGSLKRLPFLCLAQENVGLQLLAAAKAGKCYVNLLGTFESGAEKVNLRRPGRKFPQR
jgi:hypothetical protein